LKKSFVVFWKRNLAFFNLAILSNLEYRFNFIIDAMVQPTMGALIEILVWVAVFKGADSNLINGFNKDHYLSYAIWASFFARISASWAYEFKMVEEVSSGTLNTLITRPMSFYEYYLSQMLGYKFVTTLFSFIVPIIAVLFFNLPTELLKMPLAILLCFYYLILVHTISFIISTVAFHFTKVSALTVAKNLALWILAGEIFPLDLIPNPYQKWLIMLPFSSGVYLPVGYMTGRVTLDQMINGFISVSVGIIVLNIIGFKLWSIGLKEYSGTGA
jgi:ABC-2 type transport system permease protein